MNDPNQLTPSLGVPPDVADNEQPLSVDQKESLEKAIADARVEESARDVADAQKAQKETAPVEVTEPRGARAKTLTEWSLENDKKLPTREQRATDYDASLAGCGSGAYRGTACQNNWLLKRYQDEALADARAVAASEARGGFDAQEPQGPAFDKNLQPVPVENTPVPAPPLDDTVVASNDSPSFLESLRESARRGLDVVTDSASAAWGSVRDWWNSNEVELSSDSAVPLANAPEPDDPVGDFTPQKFTEKEVVQPDQERSADQDQNTPVALAEPEYAASNKESLTKEDSLAVKDAVDDAADDAAMEKAEKETENKQPAVKAPADAAGNKEALQNTKNALNRALSAQKAANDRASAKSALQRLNEFSSTASQLAQRLSVNVRNELNELAGRSGMISGILNSSDWQLFGRFGSEGAVYAELGRLADLQRQTARRLLDRLSQVVR